MPHLVALSSEVQRCTLPVIVGEAQNIFTVSVMRQTDKLFLSVSALCVALDSVFKEAALKRSACLQLSWSIRQDDQGCCQELFGDDAQTPCRCLLSQHIHQRLQRGGSGAAARSVGDMAPQRIELIPFYQSVPSGSIVAMFG